MQISPRRRDVAWNYAGTFLGIGGNFLLLPAMVFYLSNDQLGLWYVFMSIASLVLLMQFGFGPTFARNIAYCWSGAQRLSARGLADDDADAPRETNFELLRQLITASRIVFGVISLAAQLLVATLGTFYIASVADHMPREEYLAAWICFCLAIFLNMYFSYFDALLRGVGAISEINKAIVASNILKIAVTVALLASGMGLLAAALGYLLQAVAYRLICRLLLYRFKNIGARLRAVPYRRRREDVLHLLRVVSPNAARDGVVSVSNFFATTANSITCSLFLSLTETSAYSLSLQLVNAAANVSVVLITTYHPALQSAFANRNRNLEVKWISRGLSSFYVLFALAVAGLVLVVLPLLNSLRDEFALDARILLAMALYVFLWRHHSVCAAYIANTNRIPYMVPFFVSGLAGVAVSIALIDFFDLGVWGLIWGPMIVQLSYNNWKWPATVAKRLGMGYFPLLGTGFAGWFAQIGRRR